MMDGWEGKRIKGLKDEKTQDTEIKKRIKGENDEETNGQNEERIQVRENKKMRGWNDRNEKTKGSKHEGRKWRKHTKEKEQKDESINEQNDKAIKGRKHERKDKARKDGITKKMRRGNNVQFIRIQNPGRISFKKFLSHLEIQDSGWHWQMAEMDSVMLK